MIRLCIVLFCFWITSNALAQSNASDPQDVTFSGPAVNVAVSSTDETEADIFFC